LPDHVWPELRTINKYRKYYKTGKYGWYILDWKEPAPSFGNVMKTYILHPDAFNGRRTRVISVKEALLIMGYDSRFRFPQDYGLGARYQMVVDSVSPTFSYPAAKVTEEIISS
jgi:DNA (cytosine-5)-methyltransferase 1